MICSRLHVTAGGFALHGHARCDAPILSMHVLVVSARPRAHSMMIMTAVAECVYTKDCSVLHLATGCFALHHWFSWHL